MTATMETLLDAALPHVAFDGWSPATFAAACREAGIGADAARQIAPRGAVDLAAAFHRRGDRAMLARLAGADLAGMRFRDRVAAALGYRVEAMADREAVRRAAALFALPVHPALGAKLLWETADHVWTALGDTSRDGNWYSKRATLAAVWGATIVFWLGDTSAGSAATHAFIGRRIDDVMRIEGVKARLRENPATRPLMDLQEAFLSRFRAPVARDDVPGRWTPPGE